MMRIAILAAVMGVEGVGAQERTVAGQMEDRTPAKKITVTGKLTQMMAIGGESTGWAVQFAQQTKLGERSVDSMQVKFSDPKIAEKYKDRYVKVTGTVTTRHAVETGDVVVLEVTSIKGAKPPQKKS